MPNYSSEPGKNLAGLLNKNYKPRTGLFNLSGQGLKADPNQGITLGNQISMGLEDDFRSQLNLESLDKSRIDKWAKGLGTPGNQGASVTGDKKGSNIGIGNYLNAGFGLATGIADLSDINSSSMTSAQKRIASGDSAINTISNTASAFGPIGAAAGLGLNLINSIGGSLIGTPRAMRDFTINDSVANSSAFSGVTAQANDVKGDAGSYAKAGLFGKLFGGKNKILSNITQSNAMQKRTTEILDTNKKAIDAATSSTDLFIKNNINKLNGLNRSYTNGSVLFGKKGSKIHIKKENRGKFTEYKKRTGKTTEEALHSKDPHVRKMANFAKNARKWKHETGGVIAIHKEGGAISNKNVIVKGKLHAHKHTLKELKEFQDSEITLKGIPVITKEAEGGVIVQHAEVEGGEVVLHFDLTQKLEELRKEGTDAAAIAAGKLLARELMKNTKDKTGTLRSIRDKE